MLDKAQITQIQEGIANRPGPMLSLYLDVNTGRQENAKNAYAIRAKEALRALEVPGEVGGRVLEFLANYQPTGRTLMLYAGPDFLEDYTVQADLPLQGDSAGVEARWGEPYLTPLLFALDEHARTGVVRLDQEHLQYFEVFMGEIEEVEDAFRSLPVDEWRKLGEDRVGGSGGRSAGPGANGGLKGRAAGGSGKDNYNDRVGEWTARFFIQAGQLLDAHLAEKGIERLILIGVPEDAVKQFPQRVQNAVAKRLPALSVSRPSAAQVLEAVQSALGEAEREGEADLLERVRERGLSGLEPVLQALQEGRLQYLVVPYDLGAKVWRCPSGWVAPTRQALSSLCDGGEAEEVELRAVLPELAVNSGTKLEFVAGEAAERLNRELGTLAGLPRW